MAKKLFVGGLAWATTDDGLRDAFAEFGEVIDAKVVLDRETGRSRGFGFVTFAHDDEALRACEEMNEATLDGRSIRVDPAEESRRGGAPSGGGGGGGGGGQGRRRSDEGPGRQPFIPESHEPPPKDWSGGRSRANRGGKRRDRHDDDW